PNLRIRSPLLYPFELQGLGAVAPRGDPLRAGEGNRTLTASLEGWSSTIELHPQQASILSGLPFWSIQLSGWSDLNRRPLAPKASALPSCATARRPERLPPSGDDSQAAPLRQDPNCHTPRHTFQPWNSRFHSSSG